MSKSAAMLGLAAIASATYSSAPSYPEGSSAPAYGGSSSYPVGPESSYEPSYSAPAYSAPSASASYYGGEPSYSSYPSAYAPSSSSYYYSVYPSASSSYYSSAPSAGPTDFPYPSCWSECFQEAGVTSESALCGNTEVDQCIHDGCDCEDSNSYWSWYDSFCAVPSSSYGYYPSSSSYSYGVYPSASSSYYYPSSSSYYPSATPTIECWGKCFAENDITSEEELCGNTAVDACISQECSCEEDKAYWQWYESFCTASPSSSSSYPAYTTPTVPTASAVPEDCWGKCFEEAGIASESELCGNTAVDQCIHDSCSPEEDKAYWEWYMSYCPVEVPVTTPVVTPVPSATPSAPVDSCWSDCFSENGVSSEAELCGNDAVSQCIHETCSAPLDKAYWDWYTGYCVATSTGTTTCTTVYTPITTPYSPVTTTYVSTQTYGWAPIASAPAYSGLPVAPAVPTGGYSASPVQSGVAQPTGYAAPSASAWSPVPATGAGAATRPGVLFAAAMALVAFF